MTAYIYNLSLPTNLNPTTIEGVTLTGQYIQGANPLSQKPEFHPDDTLTFQLESQPLHTNATFAALKMIPTDYLSPTRNPFKDFDGLEFTIIDLIAAGTLTFRNSVPNGTGNSVFM